MQMAPPKSLELRDWLMQSNVPTPQKVDELFHGKVKEDTWLDYKCQHQNTDDFKEMLRQYVSGFGNSDGGVLVIGVEDNKQREPVRIVPCRPPNVNTPMNVWAKDICKDLLTSFSPQPIFCPPVQHPDGEVLMIVAPRAPRLIGCNHEGRLKYAFRNLDSTFWADDWMLSDMLLGRRQHPILKPELLFVELRLEPFSVQGTATELVNLKPRFAIENLGLVTAENVYAGMIALSTDDQQDRISKHLLEYVNVIPGSNPPNFTAWPWKIRHRTTRTKQPNPTVLPFEVETIEMLGSIRLPARGYAIFRCAIYLMSDGAPPTWYQLEFDTKDITVNGVNVQTARLELVTSERPEVSWTP